ncbi:MAG: LacI family DNA-binding transcriptional regulator [Capsulimonadaceae bacterium]|nr:LacI family DNA-binding transcriptional regulator [Capsulimonadaceae bacterium]
MGRVAKVSSADVARAAGVSRTTVSYVLNGVANANIPNVTRERVLKTARQMGYRINTLARGLKSGRTALIGVYCRVREDSFHERVVHGIYDICYDEGFNVLIAYLGTTELIEEESLQRMLDYNVAGIIRIVIGSLTDVEIERLGKVQTLHKTSCVLIDDATHADRFDCVISDDIAGSIAAVNHLISIGHRRIGFISAGDMTSTARARREGYYASLRLAGIPEDERLVRGVSYVPSDQLAAIHSLLAMEDRPTALFCPNDAAASIAREVARELKLSVPEELAIVGYGDSDIAYFGGLTSVDQAPEELGRLAVRRILALQDGQERPGKSILGPTRLVLRPSTVGGNFVLTGGAAGMARD